MNKKFVLASVIVLFLGCGVCFVVGLVGITLNENTTAEVARVAEVPDLSEELADAPEPTNTQEPEPTPTETNTPLPPPPEPPEPTPTATQVVPPTSTRTPLASPLTESAQQSGLTEAQVINVVDGDTIDVLINGTEYRIRYILVDTPEVSGGVEPFGREATGANRTLVEGKIVLLEKDVSETDRYGRLLRYVYVDDLMVNEELLRQGMAVVATFPPDVKYVDRFRQIEQEARAAGAGLWGDQPIAEATATQPPEPAPAEPIEPAAGGVVISNVFFDGLVSRVESDEYAEITNQGSAPVDIGGYRLNAGDNGQNFSFPSFILEPGQTCRVYTNQVHPETCGFSFGTGRAIWNNGGDCGILYNSNGEVVSQYCY